MSLTFSTEDALAFLKAFYGDDTPCVTAIHPDFGGLKSCSGDEDTLRSFINLHNGESNLYFSVNKAGREINGADKANKEDIVEAGWLHVDIDPRPGEDFAKEKERALGLLSKMANLATLLIDSGNGIQAFWKLEEPYKITDAHDIAQIEGRNRYIEIAFQGDHCFNIDRIMRLPGTVNLPNAKKRLKGRVPVVAKVLLLVLSRTYKLETFKLSATEKREAIIENLSAIPATINIDEIEELSEHVRSVIRYGDDPNKPGRWRSRSEIVFYVCAQARQRGLAREKLAAVLLNPDYRISESILEKKQSTEYALRQIRRAEERAGMSDKPVIEVNPTNLEQTLDMAEAALVNAGVEIFQMNGALVRVSRDTTEGAPCITPVDAYWLLEKFIACAAWRKFLGKEIKPYEPKIAIAQHYLARRGEWRVPMLRGIITTPTLRRDFSLLTEPGYDEASGLYYDPGTVKFPAIPEKPSKLEATAALRSLLRPFRDFPFVPDNAEDNWLPGSAPGLVSSSSRSVFISAILTGLLRPTMISAPLHIIDAPAAGTGKSKLADTVAIILTGDSAVMMTLGDDDTEDRKKLFSILSTGPRLIVIDNVERPLEGDALCTILTQQVWQDRILGKSVMTAVPTNVLFMATGNNATARGDMTRRVVTSKLDSKDPDPDKRKFDFNPVDMVKANRAELVVAALTILRAYCTSNERVVVPVMGSFEDWSVVREALVWLGEPDPEITRKSVQGDDPARIMLSEIATYWWELFQDNEMRLSGVVSSVQQTGANEAHLALRDLLGSQCPNGRLNVKSLGMWFRRFSGRIVNGYRFVRHEDPKLGTIIKLECDDPPELELFTG